MDVYHLNYKRRYVSKILMMHGMALQVVKISEEDRNGGVYARVMCYRMRHVCYAVRC